MKQRCRRIPPGCCVHRQNSQGRESLRYTGPAVNEDRTQDQFELKINLKIAKALGPTVPLALLACANEVIE
jgi:hypothetical protein